MENSRGNSSQKVTAVAYERWSHMKVRLYHLLIIIYYLFTYYHHLLIIYLFMEKELYLLLSFTYYLFIYGGRTHRSQANIVHRICQTLSKYSAPWSLKFDVFRQG